MTAVRVLRLYHSAVVAEYRRREQLLRDDHGYDVHLVCPPAWDEGGREVAVEPRGEPWLHVVPTRGRRHPILFWYASEHLRRVIRRVQPHIVDLHEEPYSLAVANALRVVRSEAPTARVCLYTAQNILKRYPPPFRQLERRALRTASAAYPCSTEAGQVLRGKGFAGALHVLPLGVSPADAPGTGKPGALLVGFVGRLEPYKGAAVAIEAFARAAIEDAALEIVGAGSQHADLRGLTRRLGIEERVSFAGAVSQDDALAAIGRFDVLVIPSLTTPSWKEQFGRVAAQAMVAGVPVLASASGSLAEVVGDAGVLAPEGDIAAFAAALRTLLTDAGLRGRLAAEGRRRATERYLWERVAEGCHRMYRDMMRVPA